MMSSSSAMSVPAHPEPAEDEPTAVDHGHPGQEPAVEGAYPGFRIAERADRKRTENSRRIGANPDQAAIARQEIGRDIAGEYHRTPRDHHEAGEIINPRLAN